MTRVLVVTGPLEPDASPIVLQERVAPELLNSEHYSQQLLERLRWAVQDAARLEDDEPA